MRSVVDQAQALELHGCVHVSLGGFDSSSMQWDAGILKNLSLTENHSPKGTQDGRSGNLNLIVLAEVEKDISTESLAKVEQYALEFGPILISRTPSTFMKSTFATASTLASDVAVGHLSPNFFIWVTNAKTRTKSLDNHSSFGLSPK